MPTHLLKPRTSFLQVFLFDSYQYCKNGVKGKSRRWPHGETVTMAGPFCTQRVLGALRAVGTLALTIWLLHTAPAAEWRETDEFGSLRNPAELTEVQGRTWVLTLASHRLGYTIFITLGSSCPSL